MPDRSLEQAVNEGVIGSLANVTVDVQPDGAAAYQAPALFTSEYAQSELGAEISPLAGYAPVLQGLQADLDPDGFVNELAQVTIEGNAYRVASEEPDGTGWLVWRLERAVSP